MMLKLRLTGLFTLLFASTVLLSSCENDDDDDVVYTLNSSLLGSNVVPSSNSGAFGTVTGNYNRDTRLLTYSVSYTGISGAVTAFHVHAFADPGFNAFPSSEFSTGIVQSFTTGSGLTPGAGQYNGTLYVDGVVIREADLLAGKYYVDLHTAAKPAGEIRAQILLKQ